MQNINAGIGVRMPHHEKILEQKPSVGFLEAHSENYFGDTLSRKALLALRQEYPVSLHGVGLSLGRADDLDEGHLQLLKSLIDDVEPMLVSEHLSWSAYSHRHLPDLLPLPLTEQALDIVCQHIEQMQDVLQRAVLVENPSNYLLFDQLQIDEPEFLNLMAQRTGCGLLLDVNNVYVSAVNLGRDPATYIKGIDSRYIQQYHLAGYSDHQAENERVLIDTHDHPVHEPVWDLFETTLKIHGKQATLFEWDSDLPDLEVLVAQAAKADDYTVRCHKELAITIMPANKSETSTSNASLEQSQQQFLDDILSLDQMAGMAQEGFQNRIWVYQNNVFGALRDYLQNVFPATQGVVGEEFFKGMVRLFVQKHPPGTGNIHYYGYELEEFVREFEPLQGLPYVGDLVAFEWAQHKAYYSDTELVFDINSLSEQEQQQLLLKPLTINGSVTIVQTDYPIAEIHRQSLPDYTGEVNISLDQGGDNFLIYKTQGMVDIDTINQSICQLMGEIKKTDTLLQAIEGLAGSISAEQQSQALAYILQKQLLVFVSE